MTPLPPSTTPPFLFIDTPGPFDPPKVIMDFIAEMSRLPDPPEEVRAALKEARGNLKESLRMHALFGRRRTQGGLGRLLEGEADLTPAERYATAREKYRVFDNTPAGRTVARGRYGPRDAASPADRTPAAPRRARGSCPRPRATRRAPCPRTPTTTPAPAGQVRQWCHRVQPEQVGRGPPYPVQLGPMIRSNRPGCP